MRWKFLMLSLLALSISASREPLEAQVSEGRRSNVGPIQAQPLEIVAQDVRQAEVVVGTTGTVISGGHLGVRLSCTPGVQAFAEKTNPDGSRAWLLTANAEEDCDGDGQSDGGGDPLFDSWSIFSPSFIQASTLNGALLHPSGDTIWVGDMLIASMVNGALEAAWGAYLLRLTPNGVVSGQAFFGEMPTGEPADVATCVALCSALTEATVEQFSGKTVAHSGNQVVIGGSKRPAHDGHVKDKDVFLALLSDDLQTIFWTYHRRVPGDDEVRHVALSSDGNVYASGYFGIHRDGFVARFDGASGEHTHAFVVAGPLDDEVNSVEVVDDPLHPGLDLIESQGFFTEFAFFKNQLVIGEGMTHFTACLTQDLEPLWVDTSGGADCSQAPAGGSLLTRSKNGLEPDAGRDPEGSVPEREAIVEALPIEEIGGRQENDPTAVSILVGNHGNCIPESSQPTRNCTELASHSDNKYVHVYGSYQNEDEDLVELTLDFELPESQPKLKTVSIEVRSLYCMSIEILLGGGLKEPGELIPLATTELCPLDEPILTFDVPREIAQELGFWNSLPPEDLECHLRMRLFGVSCGTCAGGGKDLSFDEGTAGSDYP